VIARLTNLYYKVCAQIRSICPHPLIINIISVYIYLLYVDKPAAQHTETFNKIYLLLDIYINKLCMDIHLHRIVQ